MLEKKGNGETEIQTYDVLNRLISWTDGDVEAEYTYHINNKRASKIVNGVATEHIWVGEEIQIDKIDGEMVSYVHGLRLIESNYGFYVYNAHGDVVQVVQENQIVARYDYNAYGQMIGEYAEDEYDLNSYRYAGEYRDTETGYIYLRARYYDPEISRFINVDPIKDGMNWYGYAGGNPVRYTDPSGLKRKEGAGITLGNGRRDTGKVFPPKEDPPELSVKKSQGSVTGGVAASLWWLMAADGPLPIGDVLYGGAIGVSVAIEYGPSVVNSISTYGPGIIDGMKQGVTSAVEWGIGVAQRYGSVLRNHAIQATERIFGSGVSENSTDVIGKDLGGISKKFPYGKCIDAADAMKEYLTKNKQQGSIITLTWVPYYDGKQFVWSDIANTIASDNPIHVGLLFNGKVYCNIHPYGLPEEAWINDFNYPGVKLPPIKTDF